MRAVYLVRHGIPECPPGERICLGRTDVPLAEAGRIQAEALGQYFRDLPGMTVVTSPLTRCRQTAALLSPEPIVREGLVEVDMGAWSGLGFDDIRRRWPALYQKRGEDPMGIAPPGGESLSDCGRRVFRAFEELTKNISGTDDLVIVAHSTVIRVLTAALCASDTLIPPPPPGSITQLLMTENRAFALGPAAMPGDLPSPVPEDAACTALLQAYGTPEPVIQHGMAVAEAAGALCAELRRRGLSLNERLIRSGSLLHDIAKGQPRHARAGALWLTERGYVSVAAVVGNHMLLDPEDDGRWSEKAVVFLADKLVQGTDRVTLKERFSTSLEGEKRPYALRRYRQARSLLDDLDPADRSYCSDENRCSGGSSWMNY